MQAIDIKMLEQEAAATFGEFIQSLGSFDTEKFNTVPFEGSWTAAQVGNHTYKFLDGVAKVRNLPVETTTRNYNHLVGTLKEVFLNFEVKYQSPSFVEPDKEAIDKDLLMKELSDVTKAILDLIIKEDLSLLTKGATLPTMGELTRLEWVYFGIYHTQRHNRQLQNMIQYLL